MSFSELLNAAMLGAAHHDPPAAIAAFGALPGEKRLLRGAAYEGVRLLAGRPLEHATGEGPRPGPAETLAEVPPPAATRLRDILRDRVELLQEWLGLAAARRLRVPYWLVTDLLDYAQMHPDALELVQQTGGQRLRWVAALNPAWRNAASDDALRAFEMGENRATRARGLRVLRATDPADARQRLAATWLSEDPESRAALLEALEPSLSRDDEDFVLQALRDSRKEVRQVALRLIRRIPVSDFAERWRHRAQAHVVFKRGLLGRRELELREPEFDSGWASDGAELTPPRGVGPVAWWLRQLLALAPPDVWPDDALSKFLSSDWPEPLVTGLAEAAEAYRNAEWARRLIVSWPVADDARARWPSTKMAALLGAMPASTGQDVVLQVLEKHPTQGLALLGALPGPWSAAFSHAVAGRLLDLTTGWSAAAPRALWQAALCLEPTVVAQIRCGQPASDMPAWVASQLERVVSTLEYRAQMRKELVA